MLATLERRLRAPEPVSAQGIAMLESLLTDGASPLYLPTEPGELGSRLRAAAAALEPPRDTTRSGWARRSRDEHGAEAQPARGGPQDRLWAPQPGSALAEESEATRKRFEALADDNRDVIAHAGRAVLVLGALGVVYGDIGTSPLYTEQVIFSSYKATAQITPATVYGIASLIFWALMVVVSIKYAGFIMRAHNRGDGGIMALTALLQRNKVAHGTLLVTLGIFGAALFFGDGIITPAISVLGAIQGVQVATPALSHLVVPLSVAILLGLFVLQRFGSGTIGWLFGPVILIWFSVIGLIGLSQILKDPAVFQGLSPTWAIRFLPTTAPPGISSSAASCWR